MNKIILSLYLVLSLNSFAQEYVKPAPYNEGDHLFNADIGYPNLAGIAVSTINSLSHYSNAIEQGRSIPQMTFSYGYAIDRKLSLGLYLSFSQASTPEFSVGNVLRNDYLDIDYFLEKYLGGASDAGNFDINQSVQYRVSSFSFGGRGLTHFHRSEKIDLYGRGSIGFSINKVKNISSGAEGSTLNVSIPLPEISLGGHFGMRYFFNDNWGAYGEIGYSTTDIIQVGASYRILKPVK